MVKMFDRVKFIFAWYDMWVGFYWNRESKKLYFFPLPCLGVVFDLETKMKEIPIIVYKPALEPATKDYTPSKLRCPNCSGEMLKLRAYNIWHCENSDCKWDDWQKEGWFHNKETGIDYNCFKDKPSEIV